MVDALTDEERKSLTDPRSEFTAEERVVVAMTFILSGEKSALAASRASEALGREIPAGTLRQWRRRPWWPDAEAAGKKRLQVELENGYTQVLHLTKVAIIERIENGDTRLDKDGSPVLVPVSLRDLVGAHAIIAQQRAAVRGEPGATKEETGIDLALRLARAFHQAGREALKDGAIEAEYTVTAEVAKIEDKEDGE